MLQELPGFTEGSHASEGVESGVKRGRRGREVAKRETKNFEGFKAIAVSGKESRENGIKEFAGEERRPEELPEKRNKRPRREGMLVDKLRDSLHRHYFYILVLLPGYSKKKKT